MQTRIPLNGEWQFREVGASEWLNGTVPGCVQLDLLRLGRVPDPFYRLNEVEIHRLEDKEWVYRRTFNLPEDALDSDEIELVFEGVDTIADIYVNGAYLGSSMDMFATYRFDLQDLVEPGENTLEVRFYSATTTIQAMAQHSPFQLRCSCDPARAYIRKAQYAYGWDWGPRIVQIGLWRPVYIEVTRHARLAEPFFYTESIARHEAQVRVEATVDLFGEQYPDNLEADITLAIDGHRQASTTVPVGFRRDQLMVSTSLAVQRPRLWWPNGLGQQPLYEITVTLRDADHVIDTLTFRSAIRSVKLLQETDAEGRSFVLQVNGVKVFAKGANWIPADNLLPRLTREDYYAHIRLARESNMNMLRIWGGGIYEDPAFYEACDELGIMVWQDFMYACAQYPDELDWFQGLAREEARQVLLALRNHPSIVLWCGNNENNWGFDEWWHNGVPKYLGNTIYREILPQLCDAYDPSRPYWVSSPYGDTKPNAMSDGDRHSWNVWSSWQDYDGYLQDTGRFISEFGFQAMPTWRTVLSYTAPEDRRILSPVIVGHNKMVAGTERLMRFMVGRVGLPKDLHSFVHLSQFVQAEAIKTGVEHWRLRQFMTSGALFWQFNDCWPVASWSCLDYYRRKKGLYHYARRFFDTLLPVLSKEGDEIVLRGVSDRLEEVEGKARISAYRLDGTRVLERRFSVTLPANGVSTLKKLDLRELGIGHSPRILPADGEGTTLPVERNGELLDIVFYVEMLVNGVSYTNYLVMERFRNLALRQPTIEVWVDGDQITVCSNVPAFGVFIETENEVELSDNCLNLEPDTAYTVQCSGDPGPVRVFSLPDMIADI